MRAINKLIDHTLLRATATVAEIRNLCREAREHDFCSVCVNGSYVALAKEELSGSRVKVCTVVGFPLGAMSVQAKSFETKQALQDGADEVDMVINIGKFKSGELQQVEGEIREIKQIVGEKILKVIIETCYLTSKEIVIASELAVKANADFVKTSTGFGSDGAKLEHINLIKKAVQGKASIKASGGIRDLTTALSFMDAGVGRLGTSSGVSIIKEMD